MSTEQDIVFPSPASTGQQFYNNNEIYYNSQLKVAQWLF